MLSDPRIAECIFWSHPPRDPSQSQRSMSASCPIPSLAQEQLKANLFTSQEKTWGPTGGAKARGQEVCRRAHVALFLEVQQREARVSEGRSDGALKSMR